MPGIIIVTSNVEASYDMMDLNSVESIDDFIEQIIGNLIPIVYQKYPYLKDSLLLIYKACEELLVLLKEDNKSSGNDYDLGARATYAVFRNLPRFSKCFEKNHDCGNSNNSYWKGHNVVEYKYHSRWKSRAQNWLDSSEYWST